LVPGVSALLSAFSPPPVPSKREPNLGALLNFYERAA